MKALLAVLALAGGETPPGDAQLQLSRPAAPVLYTDPHRLIANVAADGANGVNSEWELGRGPGMYIEEQRHGEEAVLAGILARRPSLWRLGLREFDWAFAHQDPSGGFPASNDPFHSTSFLIEAAAHLTLVIENSPRPLPRGLRAHVRSWRGGLERAARWLAGAPEFAAGLALDAPFTHRRFLVASALGLTSVVTGDRALARAGRQVLELGLAAQLPDGENPELGGGDDSYQARGLVYAEHYLSWLGRGPQAPRLREAIVRGLRWELAHIDPSGFVPSATNTRANGVRLDHNGTKRVVYPMVAQALLCWGLSRGRGPLVRLAARVQSWGLSHPAEVGT